jgi:molybdopterin/thiamine biosynthesis adenylyltransferase
MAEHPPVDLLLPASLWERLRTHLFQDGDEHGAVIVAGVAMSSDGGVRLLARDVFLAVDGCDYVQGERAHRMLTAEFVRDRALYCRDERLAYLAVHNHLGRDAIEFSSTDLRSHERGYPALRDILRGPPVGGIVCAENATAGDLWFAGHRRALRSMVVLGPSMQRVYPRVPRTRAPRDELYDRQARLFGDRGQLLLRDLKVGIIGLGGVGSIINEYLARLGIGRLVLVDPDRLELTNVPRVVNAARSDVGSLKVDIARLAALAANPDIQVEMIPRSIIDDDVARALAACDMLVLAADTMQARLVFNALVHQHLIPGIQIGSKIVVDRTTGRVDDVFSVMRPVTPDRGCLMCNGLISAQRLADEALSPEERRAQRYVDDPEVVAPSVITLNGVGAAIACNELLMRVVDMRSPVGAHDFVYVDARTGSVRTEEPRKDPSCLECGTSTASRFARGDTVRLPTRGWRAARQVGATWMSASTP